jgi:hypothetical protein
MNPLKHLLVAVVIAGVGLGAGGCALLGIPPLNHGVGSGTEPSVDIEDPALLLSDNTVFVTVDYLCLGNPTGSLFTAVDQGSKSGNQTMSVTCDGRFHAANVDIGPGIFGEGPAEIRAVILNNANSTRTVTVTAPQPSTSIRNQALLLSDGTVILTVDYSCIPGPGGNTVGTITTSVTQGTISSPNKSAPATCDGHSHTATTDNGPGPFNVGDAHGDADTANSTGDMVGEGADITIIPFTPPAG